MLYYIIKKMLLKAFKKKLKVKTNKKNKIKSTKETKSINSRILTKNINIIKNKDRSRNTFV